MRLQGTKIDYNSIINSMLAGKVLVHRVALRAEPDD